MKVSLKKIGLFLILLGFIANVSIAGQNPVATNTAFSKRYIPVMKREVAFVGLGTLEIGRDWGVGTQAQRSHPSDTIAQQTFLQELHTSYLDIVFIHLGPAPEKVLGNGETVAELKQLKKEGKIHYIGVSIDDPKLAIHCIESGDFDAVELEYNLLNQSNAKAIELAHQKGMAVIVRGGLGTGLLTPKVAPFLNDPDLPYRNQIKALLNLTHGSYQQLMALELAFLYSNPNISSVIIGAANPTELEEDVQLLNTFNNPELVQQAATLMQKYPSGPFTDSVDAYFAKKLNNQQSVAQN